VWLKILNGQPGTGMHREITPEGGKDVADGDLRCGAYLR
jgi:hypothetical protein